MKSNSAFIACLALAIATSQTAQAGFSSEYYSVMVRCRSNGTRVHCPTGLGSIEYGPILARQFSSAPCEYGSDFGFEQGTHSEVWVDHGCQADFYLEGY